MAALGPAASAAPRGHATIVETAVAAGQFKTLTMLLKRAGLVSTLQKPGPYTVFAPTDAAFKKVPKATLNALLQDKAKLKAVLLYHVSPASCPATKVVKLRSAKTAERGERADPRRRLERLRQQREGHEDRRDGVERRHPRRQPRADPGRVGGPTAPHRSPRPTGRGLTQACLPRPNGDPPKSG